MAAADTARLIASLELQNKLGPGIASANRDIGKLEGRLGRIGDHAKRGVQNAATNMTRLGLVAGGVLAAGVYAGVRSLEELERVTNATEGVIASTGGAAGQSAKEIRDMAQALEDITTADDKVIQGGQNLLLTFTNIGEEVFPQATKAMVDLGIAMAQGDVANADFKSSAIQLGKALNDPIKGITALSRVGVSFTQQQKDQIKAMVEAGDVAGAQTIILKELEREFGNAGEAAGKGFGADMRRFEDAVEGAQQALAKGFLPLISRVSKELQTRLSDPAVIRGIEDFGKGLADGFDKALDFARQIPWATIGEAMKLAGQGAKAALGFFTSLPPWVQTAVITGWGLNKLTGGALGGILKELGGGLIKGVLGMNAGVVNARAGVVNVAGGAAGLGGGGVVGGKATSALGKVASAIGKVFIVGAAAAFIAELVNIRGQQSEANRQQATELTAQTQEFVKVVGVEDMKKSLAGIEAYNRKLSSELTPEAIAYQLNIDGVRDAVQSQMVTLKTAINRDTILAGTASVKTQDKLDALRATAKEEFGRNHAGLDAITAATNLARERQEAGSNRTRDAVAGVTAAVNRARERNEANLNQLGAGVDQVTAATNRVRERAEAGFAAARTGIDQVTAATNRTREKLEAVRAGTMTIAEKVGFTTRAIEKKDLSVRINNSLKVTTNVNGRIFAGAVTTGTVFLTPGGPGWVDKEFV